MYGYLVILFFLKLTTAGTSVLRKFSFLVAISVLPTPLFGGERNWELGFLIEVA